MSTEFGSRSIADFYVYSLWRDEWECLTLSDMIICHSCEHTLENTSSQLLLIFVAV